MKTPIMQFFQPFVSFSLLGPNIFLSAPPPLPQYAFMAWCSFKKGQLCLYLTRSLYPSSR